MAGLWIPMRLDLGEDPAVIAIADATGLDEFGVVGRLHRLWSWANSQSRDGHASGVTEKWIDRYVRCEGFAHALVAAGWLQAESDGVTIPKFEVWNSESAKQRLLAARRQAKRRANSVTLESRCERDENVTREEKRREESISPPLPPSLDTPEFRAAWEEWNCERRARGKKLTELAKKRQLASLEPLGPEKAIACLEASITNGWTGLFPERFANGPTHKQRMGRFGRAEPTPGKYDHLAGTGSNGDHRAV